MSKVKVATVITAQMDLPFAKVTLVSHGASTQTTVPVDGDACECDCGICNGTIKGDGHHCHKPNKGCYVPV